VEEERAVSYQQGFTRGYIQGRMDAIDRDDEMWKAYHDWQVSTTFAESMRGLRTLEALSREKGHVSLAANFKSLRIEKEEWRAKNPACPKCDETLVFHSPGDEIGYCFRCKREWSLTSLHVQVPA
jgi:hypothetical protein